MGNNNGIQLVNLEQRQNLETGKYFAHENIYTFQTKNEDRVEVTDILTITALMHPHMLKVLNVAVARFINSTANLTSPISISWVL
jgi:hypothetical protein